MRGRRGRSSRARERVAARLLSQSGLAWVAEWVGERAAITLLDFRKLAAMKSRSARGREALSMMATSSLIVANAYSLSHLTKRVKIILTDTQKYQIEINFAIQPHPSFTFSTKNKQYICCYKYQNNSFGLERKCYSCR